MFSFRAVGVTVFGRLRHVSRAVRRRVGVNARRARKGFVNRRRVTDCECACDRQRVSNVARLREHEGCRRTEVLSCRAESRQTRKSEDRAADCADFRRACESLAAFNRQAFRQARDAERVAVADRSTVGRDAVVNRNALFAGACAVVVGAARAAEAFIGVAAEACEVGGAVAVRQDVVDIVCVVVVFDRDGCGIAAAEGRLCQANVSVALCRVSAGFRILFARKVDADERAVALNDGNAVAAERRSGVQARNGERFAGK